MSMLDFRNTEKVMVAGIPITTFLSDNRELIWVSASDLVEQLNLRGEREGFELEEFDLVDHVNNTTTHICIKHEDVNDFLYVMHTASGYHNENLDDFRKFFTHEVISFWKRYEPAAASLSVRDALKVIDLRMVEFARRINVPIGRVLESVYTSLGYETIPLKHNLTTEEFSFLAYAELTYLSLAADLIDSGQEPMAAMREVEDHLMVPMKQVGFLTRGISNY